MDQELTGYPPVLSHAEPVLAVQDVAETIRYWKKVLDFPGQWTWGEPPALGGASRDGAFLQFIHHPELAAASRGNSVWIRVKRPEAMYHIHQRNQAEIVSPLENRIMEWRNTRSVISMVIISILPAPWRNGKKALILYRQL